MALTDEEQIMAQEMRSSLMDAFKRNRGRGSDSIDPGFEMTPPPGYENHKRMDPRFEMIPPPGYENPEELDPGFENKWQYPPGTHRPKRPSGMDQYYSPDEKRRMLEAFWKQTQIRGELGHGQQYQGERSSIGDLIRSFRESEKQF